MADEDYGLVPYKDISELKKELESIKRFVQDRIRSRDHYKTLHHFVTLYFLKPSAAEALREKDGGIEQAPEGKTIFVIDNPDSMRTDYRPHFLTLMNIFYSAYERFKTPSETSPVHSPHQTP